MLRRTPHLLVLLPALAFSCAPHERRTTAHVDATHPSKLKQLLGRLSASQIQRDTHNRIVGLDLSDMKLSDGDIDTVAGLTTLRKLRFARSNLTDARLAELGGLHQLESLDLKYTPITDAGLAALESLTRLQKLSLWGTDIDDAGLARLRPLHRLRELDLARTRVTGTGLQHITGLTRLERLGLWGTALGEAGFDALRRLPALREIWISTDTLPSHMRRLRQARPNLTVHRLDRVD